MIIVQFHILFPFLMSFLARIPFTLEFMILSLLDFLLGRWAASDGKTPRASQSLRSSPLSSVIACLRAAEQDPHQNRCHLSLTVRPPSNPWAIAPEALAQLPVPFKEHAPIILPPKSGAQLLVSTDLVPHARVLLVTPSSPTPQAMTSTLRTCSPDTAVKMTSSVHASPSHT